MMNEQIDKMAKVIDILNKFEFFQGQRAGRELWFDKPKEIQDKDIADFVENVNYIRNYLKNAVDEGIRMSKAWAMPNSKTFRISPIKAFVEKYLKDAKVVVDPFANECKYGTITNDLNPDFDTDYHMDALDFMKMIPSESADVVLYDPPYSLRQVSECYKGVGREVTMETTQSSWRAKHLDEIKRITKSGGVVLCFGWNSAGVGKKRGFRQVEILLVSHGGSKNDTICSAEIKEQ